MAYGILGTYQQPNYARGLLDETPNATPKNSSIADYLSGYQEANEAFRIKPSTYNRYGWQPDDVVGQSQTTSTLQQPIWDIADQGGNAGAGLGDRGEAGAPGPMDRSIDNDFGLMSKEADMAMGIASKAVPGLFGATVGLGRAMGNLGTISAAEAHAMGIDPGIKSRSLFDRAFKDMRSLNTQAADMAAIAKDKEAVRNLSYNQQYSARKDRDAGPVGGIGAPGTPGGGGANGEGGSGQGDGAQGCFIASTLVSTPGGPKPIKDIVVGDTVISYDEDGELHDKEVEAVFTFKNKELYNLDGVTVTGEHPFVLPNGHYKRVQSIKVGDVLVKEDGTQHTVKDIVNTGETDTVYNLSVSDLHTYIAGGFRVHNWKHEGGMVTDGDPSTTASDVVQTTQEGEYVIKRDMVKKYGAGIMSAINEGKINPKRLKGLLDE